MSFRRWRRAGNQDALTLLSCDIFSRRKQPRLRRQCRSRITWRALYDDGKMADNSSGSRVKILMVSRQSFPIALINSGGLPVSFSRGQKRATIDIRKRNVQSSPVGVLRRSPALLRREKSNTARPPEARTMSMSCLHASRNDGVDQFDRSTGFFSSKLNVARARDTNAELVQLFARRLISLTVFSRRGLSTSSSFLPSSRPSNFARRALTSSCLSMFQVLLTIVCVVFQD